MLASPTKSNPIRSRIIQCPPGFFRTSSESIHPQSTYLAWLDLRPLNIDDNALQKALIEQEKVAIMPGYTYGEEGRGFVRLNAGCPRSKLEKGVAGLINAIRAVR